jgi:hypothetical protein
MVSYEKLGIRKILISCQNLAIFPKKFWGYGEIAE